MKRIASLTAIASLCAAAAFAHAQSTGYVGPSTKAAPAAAATAPTGYAGPSNVPLMTAKDLLAKGKDDQQVRLQGKLLSHKGGDKYEFADASGRMTVEIDDEHFPQGAKVDQNTTVELVGEFDKELVGESTLDVDQLKVVTR
ncbi:YgiW/YdeI family stress tolerance OB fold protein [Massilia sp. TN1-12]|uniref:YgiW/YdeI family stress tolerance OB fold protein n=1 Tax=Massilia paldalensis TaxID=3377675 RepID=UPI00384F0C35